MSKAIKYYVSITSPLPLLYPHFSLVNMFKNDGEYKWEDGFDNTEIVSFGPSSLVVVVTTLSQLAKHQANSLLQNLFDPLADVSSILGCKICSFLLIHLKLMLLLV